MVLPVGKYYASFPRIVAARRELLFAWQAEASRMSEAAAAEAILEIANAMRQISTLVRPGGVETDAG